MTTFIQELHENEQYFFDEVTLEKLSAFVRRFSNPCCLCAPLLGKAVADLGHQVTILDIDERFAQVPGFKHYNVYKPEKLKEEFDLILCDPPFFTVSLSQLFHCIRLLANHNYGTAVVVSYLDRRAHNIVGTFGPFNLQPSGVYATYKTVKQIDRNRIQLFTNVKID